jgi:hypothetical protein
MNLSSTERSLEKFLIVSPPPAKALGFAGSLGFSEGPALTLLGFAGLSFAPARLLFESLVKVSHASL